MERKHEISVSLEKCDFCEFNEKYIDILKKEIDYLREELKRIAYTEINKEGMG